jgi:hypothetical protein
MSAPAAPARDPRTPREWGDAVDAAYLWLLVDSARLYGLVTTDAVVDVERCVEILVRGAELGFQPTKVRPR